LGLTHFLLVAVKPLLTLSVILQWVDDHYRRTAKYPTARAGWVRAANAPLDMNWRKIDNSLRRGFCGLSVGSSLAAILEKHRGVKYQGGRPALRRGGSLTRGESLAKLIAARRVLRIEVAPLLTIARILRMADDHGYIMGRWPDVNDGPIAGHPGETWMGVEVALARGTRGLPGGSSLAQVLRLHGRGRDSGP
jgi:hypothetical protein